MLPLPWAWGAVACLKGDLQTVEWQQRVADCAHTAADVDAVAWHVHQRPYYDDDALKSEVCELPCTNQLTVDTCAVPGLSQLLPCARRRGAVGRSTLA